MQKRTIAISAVSLAVAGSLSAAAFISSSDTATGSAVQGANKPSIQTTVTVPVVEFGLSGTVRISVKNTSTVLPVKPTHVVVAAPEVVPTGTNTCPDGSFTVGPLALTLPGGALVPSQTFQVATEQLNFVDLPGDDQTGCLGATVKITATVS